MTTSQFIARARFALCHALVGLCFWTSPASGAVLHVDGGAAPGGSGASWETAMNDLRAALQAAQFGDSVFVKCGVYYATTGQDQTLNFQIPSGVRVYGGFLGTETSIEERLPDPDPETADSLVDTILSGEIGGPGFSDNTYNLLTIQQAAQGTLADRLVLMRGIPGPSFPANRGGGALLSGGRPAMTDCLFIDNEGSEGAGLWILNCTGASLTRCVFRSNRATGGNGGGVLQNSSVATYTECVFLGNSAGAAGGGLSLLFASTAFVQSCRFELNTAWPGGGALSAHIDSALTVEDCTFHKNSTALQPFASNGGAVYTNTGTHAFRRCVFSENAAQSAGAVAVQVNGTAIFESCEFTDNFSETTGGATWIASGSVRFSDCEFNGNESGTGGAIASSAPITVERCVFDGNFTHEPTNYGGALQLSSGASGSVIEACDFLNSAAVTGGAAHLSGTDYTFDRCRFLDTITEASGTLWHLSADATYTNCVMAGTSADWLGTVMFLQNSSTATIINSTIVDNTGPQTAFYVDAGSSLTLANSIVRDSGNLFNSIAGVSATYSNVEGGFAGTGNMDADPLFVDAGAGDYALSPGSPCVDAGDNLAVPDGTAWDVAGGDRFVDDPSTSDTGAGGAPVVDIGAFELQVAPPPHCGGDADGNLVVDFDDVTAVIANWGAAPVPGGDGDADGNGVVDFDDITSVIAHFNESCL